MSDVHLQVTDLRPETIAAIAAIELALEIASRGPDVDSIAFKATRNIVTSADVAAEDAIRRLLAETLEFPVVGEERGGEPPADGSPYWLVDPICGTSNFAAGTTLYSHNLGLVEAGQVTVGVVGDPSRQEICVAERGRGAWVVKDGVRQPLRASDERRMIVVEEVNSGDPRRHRMARLMAAVIVADRWDFRSIGTTLGLAYLAAGRISAYVGPFGTAVHAAAGTLLAREAGATVSDIDGRPWTVVSDSLLAASTPELHAELLDLARSTQSARSDS